MALPSTRRKASGSCFLIAPASHPAPPPPNLTIRLGSESLSPQFHIKWLGVVLDPKLSFKLQGQAAQKKGTSSILKF